ncbi:hypothetical protein BCY88_12920 [Paraburkholderia fungorum]|uniref:Uncharacterized protein n=1 Tax=Paraburkholderia fungorum TaxID=134537 RepID=A0A420FCD8_9BURK|nr:hypothetical protein BCY88_12920 [Paraburkholderia fungorum]
MEICCARPSVDENAERLFRVAHSQSYQVEFGKPAMLSVRPCAATSGQSPIEAKWLTIAVVLYQT